jgi:hypothetical protein
VIQKAAPNNGEQSDAATEPLVATASQDTAKREKFRAALRRARAEKAFSKHADKAFATKDHLVKAAYEEATRHSANAWKPELQSALKNDVYDADELKEKIKASILKLTPNKAADPDAASRKRLNNDVVSICTAAVFERFARNRSESPASRRTTESEIKTIATLSARLVKHIEGMHQTSRELVEETLPIGQLQLLKGAAASVAVASKAVRTRLADVPFCEQSTGRKVNKPAESVTRCAAAIFNRRTGRKPVRIVDRISGEAGGPFVKWLAEVFLILKIEASADAEARKYHEWISMGTTAEK